VPEQTLIFSSCVLPNDATDHIPNKPTYQKSQKVQTCEYWNCLKNTAYWEIPDGMNRVNAPCYKHYRSSNKRKQSGFSKSLYSIVSINKETQWYDRDNARTNFYNVVACQGTHIKKQLGNQ
jgi:hypothetical protein